MHHPLQGTAEPAVGLFGRPGDVEHPDDVGACPYCLTHCPDPDGCGSALDSPLLDVTTKGVYPESASPEERPAADQEDTPMSSTITLGQRTRSSMIAPLTTVAVLDGTHAIGEVGQGVPGGAWRILDAGMGVDYPAWQDYAGPAEAADAVLAARAVSPMTDIMGGLTGAERAMLDLEGEWWRDQSRKVEAIRRTFGVTETRYYQVLNSLIDRPEATAYAPGIVNRLRAWRQQSAIRRARLRAL